MGSRSSELHPGFIIVELLNIVMSATLSASEEAQLSQTIEMFEVITQSQPHDYQSLEILKEAYSKLGTREGRHRHLQTHRPGLRPDRPAFLRHPRIRNHPPALSRRSGCPGRPEGNREQGQQFSARSPPSDTFRRGQVRPTARRSPKPPAARRPRPEIDDGRRPCTRFSSRANSSPPATLISAGPRPTRPPAPGSVNEPFIQVSGRQGHPACRKKSLKVLVDKSRLAFLPLDKYDIDIDLTRTFPARHCQRWCVLPFDRMSKSIFVATANPFNRRPPRNWPTPPRTACCGTSRRRRKSSTTSAKPSANPTCPRSPNLWRTHRRRPGRGRPADRQAG